MFNGFIKRIVEYDGVVGIGHNVAVALDAIRDIRVSEQIAGHQRGHGCRVVRHRLFDQLREVNQLVITPIANVRPGVFRFGSFPVNPLACYAVGVVAVGRSGI